MTTEQFDNPSVNTDTDTPEPLPQQEEFWRPPARFGSIPVDAEPLGWDRRRGFLKLYPRVNLPTQIVERVQLGNETPHEPNRLIWGDNLHIMRQIPSNSIDLIYIDPPFFSGRQYNVMWGDNNERRSFDDIWEDGMPGYLIWLNARLYEMKRLLRPTGSIFVHCDWHASHYIKVEMDKIFGYANFRNEVVWCYSSTSQAKRNFPRKHDTIFFYSRSENWTFNVDDPALRASYKLARMPKRINDPTRNRGGSGQWKLGDDRELAERHQRGKLLPDWWELTFGPNSPERIGYPTQKPAALLERIIKGFSNEGDVVADFFVGGGTAAEVAMRLGRRFIACDQSRVAVAVTSERLKQAAMTRGLEDAPIPDFTVEQWGIYEAERLSAMPAAEFREFVLRAWGATRIGEAADGPDIHGWRNQLPVWVGEPGLVSQATAPRMCSGFRQRHRRTDGSVSAGSPARRRDAGLGLRAGCRRRSPAGYGEQRGHRR